MLSTSTVVIVAVAAAVGLFFTLALPLVLYLRAKHRRLLNNEDLAEQFHASQRARLSVGSNNYAHVPQPRTNLRRSTHLPYGIISEGWAAVPSQETLARAPMTLISNRSDTTRAVNANERRRSLRASFSAHSFSIPKTRRQKKIERAIPLGALPRSPLSSITEQSGTNTTEASPSVGIVELPTSITPKSTPEKDRNTRPLERSPGPQWPLTRTKSASSNGEPKFPVSASPNSAMMRMNTTGHSISPVRPSLGTRSISMVSAISLAPEDPLPPLPSITPSQWAPGRKAKFRLSAASVDTIGSSVLGGGRTSPSQTDTDLTSIGLATPSIDLNPTGLQPYDSESQSWEPAAVITTGSPRARHATQYRNGKAGYGSLRASIRHHPSLQSTRGNHITDLSDRRSALTTIDASDWKSDSFSRANSVKSSVSLSGAAALARNGSGCKKGIVAARHSMYERYSGLGELTADPAVLRDISGNQISPVHRPTSSRPTSFANESPFHWDMNSLQTRLSSTLKTSPGSQRKGHKRQNCVRISNLPAVDTSRRASKLPQTTEEEEDSETSASRNTFIPGLSLLEQASRAENGISGQEQGNMSPFTSRPVLEPTSWKRTTCSRATGSESMLAYKCDSDVFSDSRYDLTAPNIFSKNSTPQRQWPLSPTPTYRARAQVTPPCLRPIQEPYDPDSPTLPMPVISSATLFARAVPLGPRISVVQGPRNLPTSGRSSRTASASSTVRTSKREDLRRSVITLRRMNSDAKDKSRISQIYRNIGNESTSSLLDGNNESGQSQAERSSVSGAKVIHVNASNTNLLAPNVSQQRVSLSPSTASALTVNGLRLSKSRNKIAPSPSVMSVSATSIWEDASVRGDSPEPEVPALPRILSSHKTNAEAYENFIGQNKRNQKDQDRENRLTSPQGKGLGLTGVQLDGKKWGTPGSLYDRDGFLKE